MLVSWCSWYFSSYFFSSFDILDEKDDDTCEKKYSYDGDKGDRIPNPDNGLFFEGSDDRRFTIKCIRCVRDIELHFEVV